MAIGIGRASNADLARLETAAAGAGFALACAHQTAEEFHRALISDYLNLRSRRQTSAYLVVVAALACFLVIL